MNAEIDKFNQAQSDPYKEICEKLSNLIVENLQDAKGKIWHAQPVWFIEANPICGYSKLKSGIRLMFWSGADFEEDKLRPGTGKFKDASILYNSVEEIDNSEIKRWLKKAKVIQWDYRNVIKRKGKLERIKL